MPCDRLTPTARGVCGLVTLGCPIAKDAPGAVYHQYLGLFDALGQLNMWGHWPDHWPPTWHTASPSMPLAMAQYATGGISFKVPGTLNWAQSDGKPCGRFAVRFTQNARSSTAKNPSSADYSLVDLTPAKIAEWRDRLLAPLRPNNKCAHRPPCALSGRALVCLHGRD